MAILLKGIEVAAALFQKLEVEAAALLQHGITPKLAIVMLGERPDDLSYAKGATKKCEAIGIAVSQVRLPLQCSFEQLKEQLAQLNQDPSVHGILLMRPLPPHLDDNMVRNLLNPNKDVDGITDRALAGVFTASGVGFPPCTAQAAMALLSHYSIPVAGKHAVVLGRSLVVGRPLAMLLLSQNATVTICHTKTENLEQVCHNSQLLLVAAGKAGLVTEAFVAPKQTVIDVGIHLGSDGKLCGDVNFEAVEPIVSAITPVPGGVGSVTTAILAQHVLEAARRLTTGKKT